MTIVLKYSRFWASRVFI